jgi:hypothetical protein
METIHQPNAVRNVFESWSDARESFRSVRAASPDYKRIIRFPLGHEILRTAKLPSQPESMTMLQSVALFIFST